MKISYAHGGCKQKLVLIRPLSLILFFVTGWLSIDLYHAVTILVRFPVSISAMNANVHCASMAPDYYFVEPQFGYELEWSEIKMATP